MATTLHMHLGKQPLQREAFCMFTLVNEPARQKVNVDTCKSVAEEEVQTGSWQCLAHLAYCILQITSFVGARVLILGFRVQILGVEVQGFCIPGADNAWRTWPAESC